MFARDPRRHTDQLSKLVGFRDDALQAFRLVWFLHTGREVFLRDIFLAVRRKQCDQPLDQFLACSRDASKVPGVPDTRT